jgi:acetyl-CoA C-acetyltransferase
VREADRRVAVVGIGQLPFKTRYPDLNYQELAYEAAALAFADAGIGPSDVTGAIYAIYSDLLLRQQTPETMIHEYLGLLGKPALRITAGASTGAYALRAAYAEIAAGLADVILLVGVQKSGDLVNPTTLHRGEGTMMSESITHDVNWQHPYTPFPPAAWGLVITSHMERWGGPTLEQIGQVAVKNHANAVKNPHAQLKVELTLDEVLNSRLIAWPTTMYEACLFSESATAVVLASAPAAAALGRDPVWVTGVGTSHDSSSPRVEAEMMGRMPAIEQSARQAYAMAGIDDPSSQLDVIELHDLVAALEILSYEELGLCDLGEGGKLISSGSTELSGQLPVNPSGGRIACGHIAGPSEVYSVAEVARQLRGEAGDHQVPINKGRGLVSTIGGQCASLGAAIVLERD